MLLFFALAFSVFAPQVVLAQEQEEQEEEEMAEQVRMRQAADSTGENASLIPCMPGMPSPGCPGMMTPVMVSINTVAGDDVVSGAEKTAPLAVTGTASYPGSGTLSVNGKSYTLAYSVGGWSVSIPVADHQLFDATEVISVFVNGDNIMFMPGSASKTITYQTSPSLAINVVAVDDIINATEDDSDVTISGTTANVEDGRQVTVGLNGKTYLGTVSSNAWSATVPQADAAALNASETVTADVSNMADQNATQATRAITHDDILPSLSINAISADDYINFNDAQNAQWISGLSTHTDIVGQQVTVTLNGTPYTTTVTSSAGIVNWSVSIPASAWGSLMNGSYSITADVTDTSGNAAPQASRSFIVDTVAPSGFTVAFDQVPITSATQSAASFTISGAKIGDRYSYDISYPGQANKGNADPISGNGTILTDPMQVTGIDVSGFPDGTINLSLRVIDVANNSTAIKQATTKTTVVQNATPIAFLPTSLKVVEDAINVGLKGVGIKDSDSGDTQTVTFTITGGTLSMGTNGITFGGGGNGTASFTAQGSRTDVSAALGLATFSATPDLNGKGAGAISFFTNDGTIDSNKATLAFPIYAVNDAPSFTKGADQAANKDAGPQVVAMWATDISAGPEDEAGQALKFAARSDNAALFATQPAIAANGTLTFTPAAGIIGTATITVRISDNGGTANGGVDASTNQTFSITIETSNSAPVLTMPAAPASVYGGDVNVPLSDDFGVADADASDTQTVHIVVENGTVSLGTTGITFTGGGNGSGNFKALGSLTDINNALDAATFSTNGPGAATAVIRVTVGDGTADIPEQNLSFPILVKPLLSSASKNSDTQITVRFSKPVQTNGGNPADFKVVDGIGVLFPVSTQADGTAADNDIVLTVADLSTVVGDVTVTYTNNNNEIRDLLGGPVETDAQGVTINLDTTPPTLVSGTKDSQTQLTITFSEPVQWSGGNSSQFQVVYGQGAGIQVFSIVDGVAKDNQLVITTGDLSNATNPINVRYFNGSNEVPDFGGNALQTDIPGILIDFNAAPVATAPTAPVVNEDDVSVALFDDIGISDENATDIQTVTVSVTGGTVTLGTTGITFGGSLNGSGSFTAQGTLTAVNSALDVATFTPIPNLWGLNAGSISITSNDGSVNSNTATVTFDINAVNDNPTVIAVPSEVTVIEDVASNVDLSAMTFADLDAGANDITLQVAVGAGVLAATDAGGVVVTGSGTGTLTLTGTVSEIDSYLNSASSIMYTGAGDENGNDAATITLTGNDQGQVGSGGGQDVQLATINIDISAVNDAPSFTKGADQTIEEDAGAQTITGWATNLSVGPANEAGQTLSFAVANTNNPLFAVQPTIAANGTLTFTPAAGASGAATVTVSISDDGGTANGGVDQSADQTFSITVNAVNDGPVVNLPAAPTMLEDTQLTISGGGLRKGGAGGGIWIQDTDAGGNDLTLTLTASSPVTLKAGHTLDITAGADGTTTLTADGTVAEINAALDGLVFSPTPDANGVEQIQVDVSDNAHTGLGGAQSDSKTLRITVTPVNDAPSFTAGSDVTVGEDSGAYSAMSATNISKGPADESGQQVAFSTTATNQALFSQIPSIAPGGTLTFTPASNAHGQSTVSVQLTDDGGTANGGEDSTDPITFTITISPVNDAPVLTMPATASVDEDGSVVMAGVSVVDPDATQLTVSVTATSTATLGSTNGLLISSGANGSSSITFSGSVADVNAAFTGLTYAPKANQTTGASLTISVSDGELSDTETTSITVVAVNDLPVATDDALTLPYGRTQLLDVLLNDSDVESPTLSVVAVTQPSIGSVAINANGTLTVTAGLTDEGSTTFTYTVEDGDGGRATANVALTITGPGPDGDGIDNSIEADAPNNGDGNGDGVQDSAQNNVASVPIATGTNQGQYMTIVSPASSSLQQVYSTDIPDPSTAPSGVTFPVGRVAFKVSNIQAGQKSVVDIIMPRGVEVVSYYKYGPTADNANDHWYEFLYDGSTGAIIHVETPLTPPRVELHLVDGQRGDADLLANGVIDDPGVPIFNTNKLPVTAADIISMDEDTSTSIDVLANDTDADLDKLTITSIRQANQGLADLGSDGRVVYTPNADFNGVDSFTYVVSDGIGAPVTGTVSITVVPTPDAPIAGADSAETEEETPVTIAIFANDSDPDGDEFFLIGGATSPNAVVVFDGSVSITYTPNMGYEGVDRFFYTISDHSGLTADGWVEVTVSGSNDAPVAMADVVAINEDEGVMINVLANDSDEEGDALSIAGWASPTHGSVSASNGQLVYTPDADFNGTDSFTYTVSDGQAEVEGTVTITVLAVNDSPAFEGAVIRVTSGSFLLSTVPFTASWSEATDVDDTLLSYTWEIVWGTNSEEVLFSAAVTDGTIEVDAAALISALEIYSLVPGAQVTYFQRLVATDDEGAEGMSISQEITFARALNTSTDEAGLPTEYFLSDNYPNPFNPSTTIEFGLPEAAHVTIQLYDMNGRMVQVITNRQLAPGVHTQRIDMGTLPSGIYIYRMTAGSQSMTKTLHLIK